MSPSPSPGCWSTGVQLIEPFSLAVAINEYATSLVKALSFGSLVYRQRREFVRMLFPGISPRANFERPVRKNSRTLS